MDSYLPEDYYDLNYNGRTKISIFLIRYITMSEAIFLPMTAAFYLNGNEAKLSKKKEKLSQFRDVYMEIIR